MATQPPPTLPLFYNSLQPLSSSTHGSFKTRPSDSASFFTNAHAVPVTVDEFVMAQRFHPIVFSVGENPVPLALMGLNEGVNVHVDADGKLTAPTYVPAYVRRYPWMLARLQADAQELSLCFDPTTDLVGEFDDGFALFEDGKPTETLNGVLKFCEDFEMAAQLTNSFMNDHKELDLLIDGEVSVQMQGHEKPFIYRGFKMIAEDKLRDLHGDKLRKINQNGMLPLIIAHLFSLPLIRDLFGRQTALGKGPAGQPAAEPLTADPLQ